MLRCNFCKELARFECSGNKFCHAHEGQHKKTHKGPHQYNDTYIRLNQEEKVELDRKIDLGLKTLNESKNELVVIAAKLIKDIKLLVSEKIAEFNKISQHYKTLYRKAQFDENDVGSIEKIFSNTSTLKLNDFNHSIAKDSLQKNILELNIFCVEDFTCEKRLRLLSNEGRSLVDIIAYCNPKNIPENMLKGIMESSEGESSWNKARNEIVNFSVVAVDESNKMWLIHELFIDIIEKREKSKKAYATSLKFYSKNFVVEKNMSVNTNEGRSIKEMLAHTEKIAENALINSTEDIMVILNLAKAYAYIEDNQLKLKKYLNKLALNSTENYKLLLEISELHEFIQNTDEAIKFYLKCVIIAERTLPEDHPERGDIYFNLANIYYNTADFEKAKKFYLMSLKIREQILPEDHPDRATIYNNLGLLYNNKADYAEAEKFYLMCLKIQEQILPENHPDRANIYNNLGIYYQNKADYVKAEKFYLMCLKIREQILPENHPDRENICTNLRILQNNKADSEKRANSTRSLSSTNNNSRKSSTCLLQ